MTSLTKKEDPMKNTVMVQGKLPPVLAKIMRFDPSIRHVSLLDSRGRPSVMVEKPGMELMARGEMLNAFFVRSDILTKAMAVEDDILGKTKTWITQREKVTILWFTSKEGTILVSAEPSFPLPRVDGFRRLVEGAYGELARFRRA